MLKEVNLVFIFLDGAELVARLKISLKAVADLVVVFVEPVGLRSVDGYWGAGVFVYDRYKGVDKRLNVFLFPFTVVTCLDLAVYFLKCRNLFIIFIF
ncbi:MAG: hypothetical protein GF353_16405, partial [Candidatus Lokiarchaeota archaeon]|nr:hypothetical protein [Candidatus Lokiarchaeota archaeon]